MTRSDHDTRSRLEALEARRRLNVAADEALELAMRDRLALESTLRAMLPLLVAHTGARWAWTRTFDEDLELREFKFGGEAPVDYAPVIDAADRGDNIIRMDSGCTVIGQPLDVAGEIFGAAALVYEGRLDPKKASLIGDLLDTWCEQLDNYLASIARAREKVQVMRDLSEALRAPVLEDGVSRALEVLKKAVPFDDLLLALRHASDRAGTSLHYKIIQNGKLTHDSSRPDMEVDEFIRAHAPKMIQGESRALLERFGLGRGREEVLISGVCDKNVIGRVFVTSARDEFNTYDRDILERFADYLRQRVVDYNREWHRLRMTFSPNVVRRLLGDADYAKKYLSPRVEPTAILFADISGFTRVSEQVLKDPAKIGGLIDDWGRKVVEIVWETGGCFDKMVGDCVIALWGPPYHEMSAADACWNAATAAARIKEVTASYNHTGDIPELKGIEPPVGVATGLGYAPLCVGVFGPNEDFTGFSSGMNNTARLQGLASRDEILCSHEFVAAAGDTLVFGEEQSAPVKNVAKPLRFRSLTKIE